MHRGYIITGVHIRYMFYLKCTLMKVEKKLKKNYGTEQCTIMLLEMVDKCFNASRGM